MKYFLIIITVLLIPIILHAFFKDVESSSWVDFYGGYIGSIIGTLAVLYVANLQNQEQRKLLKIQNREQKRLIDKQIEENEKHNTILFQVEQEKIMREEFKYFLNMIRDYRKNYSAYLIENEELLDNYIQSYEEKKEINIHQIEKVEKMFKLLKSEFQIQFETYSSLGYKLGRDLGFPPSLLIQSYNNNEIEWYLQNKNRNEIMQEYYHCEKMIESHIKYMVGRLREINGFNLD